MILNWDNLSSLDFEDYQQNLSDYIAQGTNIIGTIYTDKVRISVEFESDEDTCSELVLKYFDISTPEQMYIGETRLGDIYSDWSYDAFLQMVETTLETALQSCNAAERAYTVR